MITIPIYDLLMLPGVTFFFKKDVFPDQVINSENEGEDILFLMMKSETAREDLTAEDIYPIGISGKIEKIDEEGHIRVKTLERVEISDIEVSLDSISA
ncbi:MAG: endopeptidase La, partial [Clostridia bacterium]|nr:endopeptidase La [Clostridia bacterium]